MTDYLHISNIFFLFLDFSYHIKNCLISQKQNEGSHFQNQKKKMTFSKFYIVIVQFSNLKISCEFYLNFVNKVRKTIYIYQSLFSFFFVFSYPIKIKFISSKQNSLIFELKPEWSCFRDK